MGNNIITDWAPWQNNFFLSKSELIVDQMYFANYWGPENTKKKYIFKKNDNISIRKNGNIFWWLQAFGNLYTIPKEQKTAPQKKPVMTSAKNSHG